MLVAENGIYDSRVAEALSADWRLLHATSGQRFDVMVPIWCRAGREWAALDQAERLRDVRREREHGPHRLPIAPDPPMALAITHTAQLAWCCGALGVALSDLPAIALVLSARLPAGDVAIEHINRGGPPGGWDWNRRDQSLIAVIPFASLRHAESPQDAIRYMVDTVGSFADELATEFGDSLRYWELDEGQLQRLNDRLTDLISMLWDGRDEPPEPRRRPTLLADGIRSIMSGLGEGLGEAVAKRMGL